MFSKWRIVTPENKLNKPDKLNTNDEFIVLVTKMREAQREYSTAKHWNALNEAKYYEKAVDEMLKLNKVKADDDLQQNLFEEN